MSLYQKKDTYRPLAEHDEDPHRHPFRRDYARIIHCPSFRRMQGKTQIYPGIESDFFRNRLTHSLEVAQVAKSIAIRLGYQHDLDVDYDLIETASLCHDLGHPPFGHNGEKALHECMRQYGGFEGNAQTLRIISRLEKKVINHTQPVEKDQDYRYGLNLTYRTLANVIKYDQVITTEMTQSTKGLIKGYYEIEAGLVEDIKHHVLGSKGMQYLKEENKKFKTIECSIMDLADDIAYCSYDLEDALKGGFITPIDMICCDEKTLKQVQAIINENPRIDLTIPEIKEIIKSIFSDIFSEGNAMEAVYKASNALVQSNTKRTALTSKLVHQFLNGIELVYNNEFPMLSSVQFNLETLKQIEVLKNFNYVAVIASSKMKMVEFRGKDIINTIFDILIDTRRDNKLLPEDISQIFYSYDREDKLNRTRTLCDFIAGMTDRYALEFYSRLKTVNSQTIFKPL